MKTVAIILLAVITAAVVLAGLAGVRACRALKDAIRETEKSKYDKLQKKHADLVRKYRELSRTLEDIRKNHVVTTEEDLDTLAGASYKQGWDDFRNGLFKSLDEKIPQEKKYKALLSNMYQMGRESAFEESIESMGLTEGLLDHLEGKPQNAMKPKEYNTERCRHLILAIRGAVGAHGGRLPLGGKAVLLDAWNEHNENKECLADELVAEEDGTVLYYREPDMPGGARSDVDLDCLTADELQRIMSLLSATHE